MTCLDFTIIGAQKSASTFLHECLRDHPDIYMPRYETPFFEDPFYDEAQLSTLQQVLQTGSDHKVVGIKRPDYLGRPECPNRLAKYTPHMKLIAVLRNPVDRLISAYYWYMQVGIIPVQPLEDVLPAILNGAFFQQHPKAAELLDYGFYAQHLTRYFQQFCRDQFLILFHQEIKKRPLESLKHLYRFLEVHEVHEPRVLNKTPKQTVYALPRVRFLGKANKHFFYNYKMQDDVLVLEAKKGELSKNIYRSCVALDRYVLSFFFENKKPVVSSEQYNLLLSVYEDDIACLETMLGKDLSAWREC